MNTDPDYVAQNVLTTSGFVNAAYPQGKRDILLNGLRSLKRIHAGRGWEDWLSVLNAYTMMTEEVVAELQEKELLDPDEDFRIVDVARGSPFQKRFLPRWERYEALLGANHKTLSKAERGNLRELVKTPAILVWYAGLPPHKQRQLTHPNRVITTWKALQREPLLKARRETTVAALADTANAALAAKDQFALQADKIVESEVADLKTELEALKVAKPDVTLLNDLQAENLRLRKRIAELELLVAELRAELAELRKSQPKGAKPWAAHDAKGGQA